LLPSSSHNIHVHNGNHEQEHEHNLQDHDGGGAAYPQNKESPTTTMPKAHDKAGKPTAA
jgi:hypothetical protein